MKEQDEEFIDRTTSHLVPLVGESILYDIIVKKGGFTEERLSRLEKMYASRIVSIVSLRRSDVSIPYKELLLEAASDLFTEIVLAFNILLAGVVDPSEFHIFAIGPTSYVDVHLLEIPDIIERKLRLLTASQINETTLAKSIARLIRFAIGKDFNGF
ncbi:hypothetical protein EU527_13130 [Candidatus Thorarchaeota archaeon]|nr:MAG: hypothetical protein EU527_13130 [Candidatus Thorarchaeota archaeon]